MTDRPWTRAFALLALTPAFFLEAGCVVGRSGANGNGRFGDGGPDGAISIPGFDASSCSAAVCAPLECPATMRGVSLPGECCPTLCQPSDCSLVDCPPIQCASGTHAVKPSGACCQTCVDNPAPKPGETCDQGQTGYSAFYDQTVSTLGATFCNADSDCRIVKLDNPCNHDCGTAVAARSATELKSVLSNYAADHCAACDQTGPGCPAVEQFAYCTGGVCSAH